MIKIEYIDVPEFTKEFIKVYFEKQLDCNYTYQSHQFLSIDGIDCVDIDYHFLDDDTCEEDWGRMRYELSEFKQYKRNKLISKILRCKTKSKIK